LWNNNYDVHNLKKNINCRIRRIVAETNKREIDKIVNEVHPMMATSPGPASSGDLFISLSKFSLHQQEACNLLQKHYASVVHDLHDQMQKASPKSSLEWAQKASYNMRTNKNGLSSISFLSTSMQKNHCILMTHGLIYVEKELGSNSQFLPTIWPLLGLQIHSFWPNIHKNQQKIH
jgi:hypothetical protein